MQQKSAEPTFPPNISRDSQSEGAITCSRPYEGWNAREDVFLLKSEQLTFDVPPRSASRTIQLHVPLPSEPPLPPYVVHEDSHFGRLPHLVPAFLSMTLSRLLVFGQKYGWYRSQGYCRAEAREKAWWQAGAIPANSRHP